MRPRHGGLFIKFWTEKVDRESLERKLLSLDQLKFLRFTGERGYATLRQAQQIPSDIQEEIRKSLPQLQALNKLVVG